jgi:hypothetical protein
MFFGNGPIWATVTCFKSSPTPHRMTSECSKIREFSKVDEDITTLKANVREDKHES